jgi:insertion element IS1 protein InsB
VTLVERRSSCIVGWRVCQQRDEATLQAVLDQSPPAVWYYSDLFAPYRKLVYSPGVHTPMPDKSETFRVEGVNAELRTYLARLARRSRCFSRCLHALRRALALFVFAWNHRQLYRQQYPRYPAHLFQFVYP